MVDCKICEHPYCEHAGTQRGIVLDCANYMPRQKPQTNADRIRAMSDEELADKFTDVAYEAHGRWYEPDGMTYHSQSADAKKAWLDWLRKPVKDGDNDG